MSRPTIDELLEWLDEAAALWHKFQYRESTDIPEFAAIRAIIEEHRDREQPKTNASLVEARRAFLLEERRELMLEAIRAFVERVNNRCENNNQHPTDEWWRATVLELAVLEAEVKG